MRSPFFLSITAALLTTAYSSDWYVATDGNDAWSGKLAAPNAGKTDGPFGSLAHARDAIRAARQAGDASAVTVRVRSGWYKLPTGLKFEAQDSGTKDAPAVWQAFENEKPVLIGGRTIANWEPWKDGIFQADVRSQGFEGIAFKQLFFGYERQILARYPNYDPKNPSGGGWAYAGGEMSPMYTDKEGEDKHTLLVKPQDWRKWARPEEVEVFVFPRFNWWNNILRVKSVEEEKHTVTTASDASYPMRANDRYYFQGALEELDAPGEWYLDRQAGKVYFKPPAPIANTPVYAPTIRDILRIENAEYFALRGFAFRCADGSAIALVNSNHCRIVGCTVRDVGDYDGTGINVHDGTDNGVVGCDISGTGGHGISLSGGDRTKLTAAGNFADNCYIHHVGVYYKQGAGVALSGVGQRVSHCLIHDTPRFAIQFTGNNHIVEYNHLRHLALETEDVGGTYCRGSDWIGSRGSVIRYNFIHDVLGFGWNGKWTSPYFANGIYLDDNSGGVDVIGNIVVRCSRSCLLGQGARDCRVFNNIFIEGGVHQWEFNGWTVTQDFWKRGLPEMMKGFESVASLPAWKSIRGMDVPPARIPDSEGRVMAGDVFARNIVAWKNPEANALKVAAFNPARNQFDYNLYWHNGLPLKTGQRKTGKVIGRNLAPNPNFAENPLGKMPKDWIWQVRPKPDTAAAAVMDGGHHALRMDAAIDHDKQHDNYSVIASRELELKPGTSYRLHAKLRSDQPNAKAGLAVQFFLPGTNGQPGYFWESSPSEAKLTTAWQDYEFGFTIPAKGEKDWHEKMKLFRVRLDWPAETGSLFVQDVLLQETQSLDEWQSWQTLGEQHSIIADPKFLAPEKDDYRLAPNSPAGALGFQQIPVEKIGPYASPDRASWPIVEAEGAREHPPAK